MDDAIRLLQIEGVSTVGVLLAVLFVAGVGLWRGWWVPGKQHDKTVETLTKATTELKMCETDYIEARIDLARFDERERARTGTSPARRRTRAT